MQKSAINNSTFSIETTENGVKVSFILPEKDYSDAEYLSEYEIKQRTYNLLAAFAPMLIESLGRRMDACKTKLFKNIASAASVHDGYAILYKHGNRLESFNLPSFNAMERGMNMLKDGMWDDFLRDAPVIDQTIKALMNDPQEFQTHQDMGGFAYSQLVSMLTEVHLFHE